MMVISLSVNLLPITGRITLDLVPPDNAVWITDFFLEINNPELIRDIDLRHCSNTYYHVGDIEFSNKSYSVKTEFIRKRKMYLGRFVRGSYRFQYNALVSPNTPYTFCINQYVDYPTYTGTSISGVVNLNNEKRYVNVESTIDLPFYRAKDHSLFVLPHADILDINVTIPDLSVSLTYDDLYYPDDTLFD